MLRSGSVSEGRAGAKTEASAAANITLVSRQRMPSRLPCVGLRRLGVVPPTPASLDGHKRAFDTTLLCDDTAPIGNVPASISTPGQERERNAGRAFSVPSIAQKVNGIMIELFHAACRARGWRDGTAR